MLFSVLVLTSLFAGPSGATSLEEDSHVVHQYLLQQYRKTTDTQGNIRPGAQPEDLATWGFLDDFSG